VLLARGSSSIILRFLVISSAAATRNPKTGLLYTSTNLCLSAIREKSSAPTLYKVSASNFETITTLGTFANPSASSKIRFKEINSTSNKGLYEIQFHDSCGLFGASDTSKYVDISIYEETTTVLGILVENYRVFLTGLDLQESVRAGLTSLPNNTNLADFATTGYNATTHKVAGVATVDTCTTNSDMRGTNNALLANDSKLTCLDASIASRLISTDTRLNNLDAAITSRLSGSDSRLNNLDSTVSSRLAGNDNKLNNLDASISSRMASGALVSLTTAYEKAKTALQPSDTVNISQDSIDSIKSGLSTENSINNLGTSLSLKIDTAESNLASDHSYIKADTESCISLLAANTITLESLSGSNPSSTQKYPYSKNVKLKDIIFTMLDADGIIAIGKIIQAKVRINNGYFVDCVNGVLEIYPGIYSLDLEASEMNGESITILLTSSSTETKLITIRTS
jgi:hypothetical protein